MGSPCSDGCEDAAAVERHRDEGDDDRAGGHRGGNAVFLLK
jgi:hypothetical protein